jgi:hypothetical protein
MNMTQDELSKLTTAIDELQDAVGDAPHMDPDALARLREIDATCRADSRCTTYIEEKLDNASDDASYWFGGRDWRERTTTTDHLRSMLMNSLEALGMAATTTYRGK